jgi:hypothetical protein
MDVAVPPDVIDEEAVIAVVIRIEGEGEHSLEPAAADSCAEVEERSTQKLGTVGNSNSPGLLDDVEAVAAAAWSRSHENRASQTSDDVRQRWCTNDGARVRLTPADGENDRRCADQRYNDAREGHRSPALFTMRTVSEPAQVLAFPTLRFAAVGSTMLGTVSGRQHLADGDRDRRCGPVAFLIEWSFPRGPR